MGNLPLRERKKRETRERLVKGALASFSRQGFEATSLRDLADGLDVSVPTLRNYFGSKDGLLVAVLERVIGVVERGVQAIVDQQIEDPAEVLQSALAMNASNRPLPRDLLAHVMRVAATESEVSRVLERLRATLERVMVHARDHAGGRSDVEPERLAQIVADLILGAMVDWVQSPEADSRAHTEVVLRVAAELVVPQIAGGERSPAEQAIESLPLAPPGVPGPRSRSDVPLRIQQVARRRFAEDGVRETSIDAIAEELSISPLTVFYHFGSKDGLLAAMAVEMADVIQEGVEAALEREKVDLREGIAVIPQRIAELPPFGPRLTAELLRVMVTHPDGMAASRRIHAAMARLVAEGQRRGLVRMDHGPRVLARVTLNLTYAGVLRWVQEPSRSVPESALESMRAVRLLLARLPSEPAD